MASPPATGGVLHRASKGNGQTSGSHLDAGPTHGSQGARLHFTFLTPALCPFSACPSSHVGEAGLSGPLTAHFLGKPHWGLRPLPSLLYLGTWGSGKNYSGPTAPGP